MIENSMFEEEPDVVDLAKDSSSSFPVCSFKDLPFLPCFFYLYKEDFKMQEMAHLQGWVEFYENNMISKSEL